VLADFVGPLAVREQTTTKARAIDLQFRPMGFTPAFGRVVAALRRVSMARLKPCP
jgi:hypothetical protein